MIQLIVSVDEDIVPGRVSPLERVTARLRRLVGTLGTYHYIATGVALRNLVVMQLAVCFRNGTGVAIHYCPSLGEEAYQGTAGRVRLCDGTEINSTELFAGGSHRGWNLVGYITTHALICADQEFLRVLGLGGLIQPGSHLYIIDPDKRSAILVE